MPWVRGKPFQIQQDCYYKSPQVPLSCLQKCETFPLQEIHSPPNHYQKTKNKTKWRFFQNAILYFLPGVKAASQKNIAGFKTASSTVKSENVNNMTNPLFLIQQQKLRELMDIYLPAKKKGNVKIENDLDPNIGLKPTTDFNFLRETERSQWFYDVKTLPNDAVVKDIISTGGIIPLTTIMLPLFSNSCTFMTRSHTSSKPETVVQYLSENFNFIVTPTVKLLLNKVKCQEVEEKVMDYHSDVSLENALCQYGMERPKTECLSSTTLRWENVREDNLLKRSHESK